MATQVSLNSGAVASSGALAIQTNGTTQAVSISTGQVATLAQNPILTSGTANGVAYLNGSKVLTTASALTWSGNLLSATTSVAGNSNVLSLINSNTAGGGQGVGISGFSTNGSNSLGSIQFGGAGALGGNLDFYTANSSGTNTLNMRLDTSGNLLVGTTGATGKRIAAVVANNDTVFYAESGSSFTGGHILAASATAAGTGWYHLVGQSSGGTNNIFIYGNGNIQNANNSYGAISDAKLKENIVDATPKLEKLMQVRIRNYNLKGEYEQHKQLGVVAQELETVFPSMVEEAFDRDADGNILETTTKSVKYSVFVPMLIKAIQEQQALITTLTARITALEGA